MTNNVIWKIESYIRALFYETRRKKRQNARQASHFIAFAQLV